MPDNSKILVRNARDQDIPAVVEIDTEAFRVEKEIDERVKSLYGL